MVIIGLLVYQLKHPTRGEPANLRDLAARDANLYLDTYQHTAGPSASIERENQIRTNVGDTGL